jgi:hypothetical protein
LHVHVSKQQCPPFGHVPQLTKCPQLLTALPQAWKLLSQVTETGSSTHVPQTLGVPPPPHVAGAVQSALVRHPTQAPEPLHTPPEHGVSAGAFGCVQLPEPLHTSDVHAFPSEVQEAPFALLVTVQPPLPLHVELAWHVVGVHV